MTLNDLEKVTPVGVSITQNKKQESENQQVMLVITPEILTIIKEEDIDINQLFIMLAMYDRAIGLLDLYDEDNTRTDILKLQYQDLYIHGFLEDCDGNETYQISQKGRDFVERVRPLFEIEEEEDMETEEDFKQLCQNYLELFPRTKLPSGKYARVSIVEIEKKMRSFIKIYKPVFRKTYNFKLTHQDILRATKAYIDRYAKSGYKFMVTSSYFIQKNEKSALADEILATKEGLDAVKTNFTTM